MEPQTQSMVEVDKLYFVLPCTADTYKNIKMKLLKLQENSFKVVKVPVFLNTDI